MNITNYTLYDVWTPIRNTIASDIVSNYGYTTSSTITSAEGAKIEALLYNYCHALLNCTMAFADECTLGELQTMLRQTIRHKVYALVTEWKAMSSFIDVNAGKLIHQESFYDVADTPRIEVKDWNEVDIKIKQLDAMFSQGKAIKDLYNEIKQLVITLYI